MNTDSKAFLPRILTNQQSQWIYNIGSVVFGVAFISILAQASITLPFTPVPITGQTFGVALIALLWGSRRAFATTASYLLLGAMGLPIFAMGKAGLAFGPTMGYLFGMMIASLWMGFLADRGWTKSFLKTWLAAISGSMVVYTFGLLVLSQFVPANTLFIAGLFPFIPGDLIKTTLVALIASQTNKRGKR